MLKIRIQSNYLEKDSAIVSVEDDFIDDEVKCEIADDSIANAEYKKESFIDDLDSGKSKTCIPDYQRKF